MTWQRTAEFCTDLRTLSGMTLVSRPDNPTFTNNPTFRTGHYVARWGLTNRRAIGWYWNNPYGNRFVRFGAHVNVTAISTGIGVATSLLFAFGGGVNMRGIAVSDEGNLQWAAWDFETERYVFEDLGMTLLEFLGSFDRWVYISGMVGSMMIDFYVDRELRLQVNQPGFTGVSGMLFGGLWPTGSFYATLYSNLHIANVIVDTSTDDYDGQSNELVCHGTELWNLPYTTDVTPAELAPWTPQLAATVLECIDDLPHDGDATYAAAESAGAVFHAESSAFALPNGYKVEAVIPYVIGAVLGSPDGEINLVISQNNGSGTYLEEKLDPAQKPISTYQYLSARFDEDVLDQPWTEQTVNNVRKGFETV